jgi:hypothetical protein
MKKIFISLSACLAAFGSPAFAATDPGPGQQVLESFKKEFINAEYVSWEKQEDFDKVTFMLAGSRAVAFYNNSGQLAGSIRDIFFNQLPLAVMTAVDRRFPEADVYDVREITNDEGTSYRLTVEEKGKKKTVRVDASGRINNVEKQ